MAASETFPLTEPKPSAPASALDQLEVAPACKKEIDREYERVISLPREQAKKLKEVVFNLNDKMAALLEKEKQEFLAAYRAHTRKIQQELVTLRARVAAEESSMQKDERVRQLVAERDRYRQDALHLDEETVVMKKRLTNMAEELETLEDDRNFLIRQLKSSKHRNEVLRSELTLLDSQTGETAASTTMADPKELMSGIDATMTGRAELPHLPASSSAASQPPAGRSPQQAAATPKLNCSAKIVAALRRELRKVQNQAAAERKAVEDLRVQVAQLQAQRGANELERAFVDVIRQVEDDIALRRRKAEAAASKQRPPSDNTLGITEVQRPSKLDEVLLSDVWGEQPLRLDPFTASDRCSVLRIFLERQRQDAGPAVQ